MPTDKRKDAALELNNARAIARQKIRIGSDGKPVLNTNDTIAVARRVVQAETAVARVIVAENEAIVTEFSKRAAVADKNKDNSITVLMDALPNGVTVDEVTQAMDRLLERRGQVFDNAENQVSYAVDKTRESNSQENKRLLQGAISKKKTALTSIEEAKKNPYQEALKEVDTAKK